MEKKCAVTQRVEPLMQDTDLIDIVLAARIVRPRPVVQRPARGHMSQNTNIHLVAKLLRHERTSTTIAPAKSPNRRTHTSLEKKPIGASTPERRRAVMITTFCGARAILSIRIPEDQPIVPLTMGHDIMVTTDHMITTMRLWKERDPDIMLGAIHTASIKGRMIAKTFLKKTLIMDTAVVSIPRADLVPMTIVTGELRHMNVLTRDLLVLHSGFQSTQKYKVSVNLSSAVSQEQVLID